MQTQKHRAPSTLSPAPTPPPCRLEGGGTGGGDVYRQHPAGRGGVGSGAGATTRRSRLNVTAAERLCYSRRKLEAISALRSMGVDPTIFGLHKDYRVPGKRGKVYLVQHPTGTIYSFRTLRRIRRYVADSLAWKAHAYRTWDEWRKEAPMSKPERVPCSWEECPYDAASMLRGRLLCQAHAMLVEQLLVARGKRP